MMKRLRIILAASLLTSALISDANAFTTDGEAAHVLTAALVLSGVLSIVVTGLAFVFAHGIAAFFGMDAATSLEALRKESSQLATFSSFFVAGSILLDQNRRISSAWIRHGGRP